MQYAQNLNWQSLKKYDPFPHENAIVAGYDVDRAPIFVGRAYHEGDLIPAKVIPSKDVAYVSYGGFEIAKHNFEILRAPKFIWQPGSRGSVPRGAVPVGRTASGEPLYVGRGFYQGSQTPGKVHCSHGCLYIPFGGQEIRLDTYEVLVQL